MPIRFQEHIQVNILIRFKEYILVNILVNCI